MSPLVWLGCLTFAVIYTAAVLFIAKAISTPDDDEYAAIRWRGLDDDAYLLSLPQELTDEQAQHIKDAWASMPHRIEHKPGYRSGRREYRTLDRLGSLGGQRPPEPPAPTTPDPGLPERVERWERRRASGG